MEFKLKYSVKPQKLRRHRNLATVPKQKSVQGRQSEMSTHGEMFLDSSKTREGSYFHRTRVHIYQVWKGVINIRLKRILEGHYQLMPEK